MVILEALASGGAKSKPAADKAPSPTREPTALKNNTIQPKAPAVVNQAAQSSTTDKHL